MAAGTKVLDKDFVPPVVHEPRVDVAAESEVPEVTEEEKNFREVNAPSANNPTSNDKLPGGPPADWETRPFEWSSATPDDYIPVEILETDQKKFLNPYNSVAAVTIKPGHRFTAPGRYHDLRDIEKYYDVEAGSILPDDIYVVSERYLLPEFDRKQLRGEK